MASKVHSRNGNATETPGTVTKYEIRDSDVVESHRTVEAASAPEKEAKPVADHPTVTELAPAAKTTILKKVTQSMQIPVVDAENFIGVEGTTNISNIGVTSGSILTLQESKGLPKDNAVEIKGELSQVQTTKKLIQTGIDQVLTGHPSRRCKLRRQRWSCHAHATSPSAEPSPRLAATEKPVESQKEPILVEVPPQLPQVQPATALKAIETKPVVPAKTKPSGAFGGPVRMRFLNTPRVDQALTGAAHSHKKRRHVTPAPSSMESIKEIKRNRYFWNDNIVKTFLDACIHEITINGREGGSLKAMSWKKVGETLKERHNFSVDNKQMKNYFDGLKSKYMAWVSLKNKAGNKYDPSTNMFNLTDKEWETELKKNKYIDTLRIAPLRFPDLCAQLFDGGVDQALTKLPPLLGTETPVKPKKEPILVEVPPELLKVQPASEVVAMEKT